MLAGLWRYRSFVLGMARREFEARYRGSALGTVWAIASPLAMIFIYTVVFGHMMRARLSGVDDPLAYGIFLCAGCSTWNMFAEILQRCVNVFVDQGNLLKKMSFPRVTLPAIVFVSGIVNFAIVLGIFLGSGVVGRFPGWVLGRVRSAAGRCTSLRARCRARARRRQRLLSRRRSRTRRHASVLVLVHAHRVSARPRGRARPGR